MRIRDNNIVADIYIGKRSLRLIQDELDVLRRQCGQSLDVLTSTQAFLADTARWNTFPVVVLMRKEIAPFGAVLLHGHTKYGVPTGMLTAGHQCGRGATIALIAERPIVAEIAARVLLRSLLFHTVAIRLLRCNVEDGMAAEARSCEVEGHWLARDARSCISLEGGMEGLMSRFSHKMRRNLRYYRRRAEKDQACVFVPKLSPMQSRQAVEALHGSSRYPISTAIALRYEAALRDTPGSFAIGLQDGSGAWLSFLAGLRQAGVTYVLWQLNLIDRDATSISTVMRAYVLEHEISQASLQIIFVGGTTPAWSRVCVPQVCDDLLVVRKGMIAAMARAFLQRISPRGQMAAIHARAANGPFFRGNRPE